MPTRALPFVTMWLAVAAVVSAGHAGTDSRETITLHGHAQKLLVSGPANGSPVIVSSGDGGWIHLAPHVAGVLAAQGFRVIGFDTRAYLEGSTSSGATLSQDDVRGDYGVLADYAARATHQRPLLVGVSEGAGLSVLAATGARTRGMVRGVIALGLPSISELAWRWKDAVIYLTHGVPREPTFRVDQLVGRVGPLPLAAVHSTGDEFVPVAEIERILNEASEPKRLWTVKASDHGFSDNLVDFDRRLLEAIEWATTYAVR